MPKVVRKSKSRVVVRKSKTRAQWAAEIIAAHKQSVESILKIGHTLIAAKKALAHGEFLKMIEHDLPFDASTAQRLFLFGVCRGVASAAVRLGLVGTTEAQRIIGEMAGEIERTVARCSALTMDDAAQTAPLIDLWQSSHDRLYSRLFQS